jgi:hypothetical protein
LIKYIRKNSLLVSEFLCYMRSIKSKCIINYIFCIRQMRLQITFPPNDCNLVICHNINSSLFGNKPIKYKFRSITIQFYFTVKRWIKYNSEGLKIFAYKNILIKK